MKAKRRWLLLSSIMTFSLISSWIYAAGDGQRHGAEKCQFNAFFEDPSKNRLFMKLDVEAAIEGLPESGSQSRNDDLAGHQLTVTVGNQAFTETVEANGRVNTQTFKARLNANGRTLHVDLRELDLVALLGLDPAQSGKDLTASLTVLITSVLTSEGAETPTDPNTLWSGTIDFTYQQKADVKAKGTNE